MHEGRANSAHPRLATGLATGAIACLAIGLPEWLSLSSWKPVPLLVVLAAFAWINYRFLSVDSGGVRYSASFLVVLLAAAFFGPAPAALIGVANELIVWAFERYRLTALVGNIAAYGWAGVVAGVAFQLARTTLGVPEGSFLFFLAFLPIGLMTVLPIQVFVFGVVYGIADGKGFFSRESRSLLVTAPSHVFTFCLGGMIALLYVEFGIAASAAVLGVALMNQFLIQRLLAAHDETKRLASLNTGILASLVRGLHMRDRDTARHSAAVARYAREMAEELGWSKERQELVHTAALLHDIGKFAFPDRILKGGHDLADADWEHVYKHPEMGAELLRSVSGYGPIAAIVAAHHERPDGRGYPDALKRDEIPEASRLIAVADAYDVITARGGYNKGRSSFEALQELRRCSHTQFDGEFVEALSRVMAGRDLRFRHGDDADFDAEVNVGSKQLRIAVG